MGQGFEKRLSALQAAGAAGLAGGLKGIEKESLRTDSKGQLAQTPHPPALGSALTNRYITTDFSEALLEFISPALANTWEALRFLCDVHQFTYSKLGDELLWSASMPCRIPPDEQIPLAYYGESNVGRMKTIYRRGLGYRYGRNMQTIAGVHFNYSVPAEFWPAYREHQGGQQNVDDFRSVQYLGLVRNFRRLGWLVLYLSGASPAMCRSFSAGGELDMPQLNPDTWYEPYATSLRMSDLGYSNRNQASINISLNSLDEYVEDLGAAIRTPEPRYEEIGIKVNGEYRQLNANLLQIENEYYSSIRPKRAAMSGERPTAALQRGGVEYVEIRALDLSLEDPAGINQNTMRFMEAFLLYCLLESSPLLDEAGLEEARENQASTAKRGRDPAFRLRRDGIPVPLRDWAHEILDKVAAVAELVDAAEPGGSYAESVSRMRELVADPDRTPSAQILARLADTRSTFFELALDISWRHRDYFAAIAPLLPERAVEFDAEVRDSIERQGKIEAAEDETLDQYLARYFS